ncbi:MAG: AraC-like DNA-binding protein [Glaciecola sp.]
MLLNKSTFILIIIYLFISNTIFGFESIGQVESASKPNFEVSQDSLDIIIEFRNLARIYADRLQADKAINYAEKYIRATSDLSIINDHFFSKISQTDIYLNFKSNYKPKVETLPLLYLFASLIGLFIFVILNLKKGINRVGTFLMSLFVLLNSLFILHLSLYLINCQYYFPNTLLFSTVFTLLYGPLIYFYFKITAVNYKLKWVDALHLIPAVGLLVYISPFYALSSIEKFIILFDQEDILINEANFIIAAKIISLVLYAFLTYRIYLISKAKSKKKFKLLWQRNIIAIYVTYVVTFILYTTITSGFFDVPIFFHLQILIVVGLVFYVAYITYVQPEVFKGEVKLVDPIGIFKYKSSALTPSYSLELKEELLSLLDDDKIYKESGISLDLLSEKLGTSRHNTSQIINEHFNMNFYELMNKYRIDEAIQLIKNGKENKLNIIDIAYKVGFNNKVSFNKSFKKALSVTPTQYIKSLEAE